MSKPDTKKKRKQFAKEESMIRKVFLDCEPMSFPTPDDEYDCLVHHLISILHSGGSQQDIAAKIKDKFEHHFGIFISDKEIDSIAQKVWDCGKAE